VNDERQVLSVSVTEDAHGVVVVSLAGELDFVGGEDLSARLAKIPVAGGPPVVLDVSAVRFIDSTGLNALVTAARAIEVNGGSVVVAGPSAHVRRVFEIARLDDSFRLEETLDGALRAALSPHPAK
jgi:anti-sigma B factor antagonist